jgi:hypothetical protein
LGLDYRQSAYQKLGIEPTKGVIMHITTVRSFGFALAMVLAASVLGTPSSAQIQNPLKAARDAFNKARQEEEQRRQQQKQQQGQPQTQQAPPAAGSPAVAAGDCCSPEALRKIATSAGFVDIVGIKLGMTPEQAFAAVKAHNGQMKIDIINASMEDPDVPRGDRPVPQFAVAHTVGAPRGPNPTPFTLADYSWDVIVIEFSVPPSPPLVGRIVREVGFPQGQLVVAANLLDALRKKYGPESLQGIATSWVFDATGKLVSRPLRAEERSCLPNGARFGWNGMPQPEHMDRVYPTGVTRAHLEGVGLDRGETSSACRPFVIVEAYPFSENLPPAQQLGSMTVLAQSPALLYGSGKAALDWIKAKADAKAKQQEDAAKARSAPKL